MLSCRVGRTRKIRQRRSSGPQHGILRAASRSVPCCSQKGAKALGVHSPDAFAQPQLQAVPAPHSPHQQGSSQAQPLQLRQHCHIMQGGHQGGIAHGSRKTNQHSAAAAAGRPPPPPPLGCRCWRQTPRCCRHLQGVILCLGFRVQQAPRPQVLVGRQVQLVCVCRHTEQRVAQRRLQAGRIYAGRRW